MSVSPAYHPPVEATNQAASELSVGHAVPETERRSPYLVVGEVADRLRLSVRQVHEMTRLGRIPHRKMPGVRRCLFLPGELEAWENGAALSVKEIPGGGRIVTPVRS
ncbi:MAG: helix-turn-helix domain-containing protein [Patescibacteria group bacterium]|nr:helix-turn-helix domain-containing protein [Patescibacteria group bacterium]